MSKWEDYNSLALHKAQRGGARKVKAPRYSQGDLMLDLNPTKLSKTVDQRRALWTKGEPTTWYLKGAAFQWCGQSVWPVRCVRAEALEREAPRGDDPACPGSFVPDGPGRLRLRGQQSERATEKQESEVSPAHSILKCWLPFSKSSDSWKRTSNAFLHFHYYK